MAARCVRVIHARCVLQFALLSRTLLRSSSNNEPSDPPYRIIFFYFRIIIYIRFIFNDKQQWFVEWKGLKQDIITNKCYYILVSFIMVRHNHIYIWMCEVKSLLYDWIVKKQSKTVMIHTQVHLRIPCYDFYFL